MGTGNITNGSPQHQARLAAIHEASEQGSAGLWDHFRTTVRHRWWAIGGFLLLAAPMVAITLLTTPVYFATTRLLISEDADQRVGLTSTNQTPPRAALDAQTQSELVTSRALVKEVVLAMKLWESPEFAEAAAGAPDDATRADRLIDPFLGHLSVALVPDSQVMIIGFEAHDPALAATAANNVANRYIERDRESRFLAATSGAEWLTKRLAEQRNQVSATETALQTYRADQDAISLSDRQNIVGQKLQDLNAAVTRAKTDRILRETQYQQIQGIKGNPAALEAHPLVAANSFIQTLKAQNSELARQDAQLSDRLGPKHPDRIQIATALETVQSRLRAEIGKIVSGIETDYQAAVTQESSLTQALNSQKTEAYALDSKGVQYSALEREAVSARQVYDALLQQTKEAALSSDIQKSSVRVVDAAEPPAVPVRPRRNQGLAAATLLGLIGAASGAFGREYLRRRIYSPADLERRLGISVLALVPPATPEEGTSATSLSPLPAEAFRRLRANVMLAAADDAQPGNVLVITSAAPGEGKTFVSSHLAVSLAAVDQRVVLIDADMRRTRLHTMFDRRRAPGLSDVLLGRRSAAEVLRPVGTQGLVVVPSGIPTAQASELLSLQSFRTFVEDLRSDFDWIVIDSPPIMAVADAAVLSREASAVLFVTSAERTSLEAAEAALKELDDAGARIVGAVLKRAPISKESFYYSRYYRPEYNAYLTPSEDAAPAEAPVRTS
jgi:capsular exopolysaccharide synthesis family protein